MNEKFVNKLQVNHRHSTPYLRFQDMGNAENQWWYGKHPKLKLENVYQSHSQVEIAKELAAEYANVVAKKDELGGQKIAGIITQLAEKVWNETDPAKPQKGPDLTADFDKILAQFDDATNEQRTQLMEAYARLGHLYEISGLVARDNFFRSERILNGFASASTTDYVKCFPDNKSIHDIVAATNKPIFKITTTAHPTDVNSQKMVEAVHDLGKALDRVRGYSQLGEHMPSIQNAIDQFANAPLQPMDDKGHARNLTVEEETSQGLYYLKNVYNELQRIYKKFDGPLQARAEDHGAKYDPLTLKLSIQFSRWDASADKDGNPNVNALSTLDAMVQSRLAILTLYRDDLKKLEQYANGGTWAKTLDDSVQTLNTVLSDVRKLATRVKNLKNNPLDDYDNKFNALSQGLRDATDKVDLNSLRQELATHFRDMEKKCAEISTDPNNKFAHETQKTLNLIRAIDHFGMGFAPLEYRETAIEYTTAVGLLVDEYNRREETGAKSYDDMEESERITALEGFINDPEKARTTMQGLLKELEEKGAKQGYVLLDENGNPIPGPDGKPLPNRHAIAYHTLKRMELARDHPDMVLDNVLAECEQTSNLLEAVFLQVAASTPEKRAHLGVVPLFEKPEVLDRVGEIMGSAFSNQTYKAHLKEQADLRWDGQLKQTAQLAHSDNTRRTGMAGARPKIYNAHNTLRDVAKNYGVTMQFHEGGSQLDSYRNGLRSQTATMNLYGIHDYYQTTYQGGDRMGYLNFAGAITRLFVRNLTAAAAKLAGLVGFNGVRDTVRIRPANPAAEPKRMMDSYLSAALEGTQTHYEEAFFSTDKNHPFTALYNQIGFGFALESRSAAAGSRPPARADKASPTTSRTITYSEILQHNQIAPHWLGCGVLEEKLREQLTAFKNAAATGNPSFDDKFLLRELSTAGDNLTAPQILNRMYQHSPMFKEVMDRIAFGIANADLDNMEKNNPEINKEMILTLRTEYSNAARIVYSALTGMDVAKPGETLSCTEIADKMVDALPHLKQTLLDKSRYGSFALDFKNRAMQTWWKGQEWINDANAKIPDTILNVGRATHTALDHVSHGMYLAVQDPDYGMKIAKAKGINLAYGEPAMGMGK